MGLFKYFFGYDNPTENKEWVEKQWGRMNALELENKRLQEKLKEIEDLEEAYHKELVTKDVTVCDRCKKSLTEKLDNELVKKILNQIKTGEEEVLVSETDETIYNVFHSSRDGCCGYTIWDHIATCKTKENAIRVAYDHLKKNKQLLGDYQKALLTERVKMHDAFTIENKYIAFAYRNKGSNDYGDVSGCIIETSNIMQGDKNLNKKC